MRDCRTTFTIKASRWALFWEWRSLSHPRCPAVSKFAQTMRHLLRVIAASTVMIVVLGGGQSRADWPERPITIIVPFGQGGPTDLRGRLLATRLTMRLGEPVVVENSVGEVGNVGLRAAARATPNGYTLLVTTNAALINLAINPRLSIKHAGRLRANCLPR
jgi:Tripartite tricarboxylate transporter family receptor